MDRINNFATFCNLDFEYFNQIVATHYRAVFFFSGKNTFFIHFSSTILDLAIYLFFRLILQIIICVLVQYTAYQYLLNIIHLYN